MLVFQKIWRSFSFHLRFEIRTFTILPTKRNFQELIKEGVLLNRAPTSAQLHSPTHSSFKPPPCSLQHPQQYLNQNIAHNGAISPNLGQKIKSCPFWLKIGTYGILEVLNPNPDLNFWNSDPKIYFWANLDPKIQSCSFGRKSQSCLFFLKIGTHVIFMMLILIPTLVFRISNPKSIFGKIWIKKVKVVQFSWKLAHRVSRRC